MKVSDGCKRCYAETLARRTGNDVWGPPERSHRRLFGDAHWLEPVKWNKSAFDGNRKDRVFCGSMCDVFEDHPDVIAERQRLFELIRRTKSLTWLLLTKRIENVMEMVPEDWRGGFPSNVWIGTSVENQYYADKRLRYLSAIQASVRFVSCEPLLEMVTLKEFLTDVTPIDWVIVGGESGAGKRHFDADWARQIRDECLENGVAFFMKQIDKIQPVPEDLQIRQLPNPLESLMEELF